MIKRHKEGRGFNFFHFMIDLKGGPCVAKTFRLWIRNRVPGCYTMGRFLSVHQFVGEDDFLMGNVDDGIKPDIG